MIKKMKVGILSWAGGMAIAAMAHNANAMTLQSTDLEIDTGLVGTVDVSGGAEGDLYAFSGTGEDSRLGEVKQSGAQARALNLMIKKDTGLIQFTVSLLPHSSLYMGVKPSTISTSTYTTGPLYAGYVTLVPNEHFKFSVGQFPSSEGWESSTSWRNDNIILSPLFYVQNSASRGVQGTVREGKFEAALTYGDGFDSGAFNTFQELVTYSFDHDNALSFYGTQNVGRTGPHTFAYGGGDTGLGYASYYSAYVNSDMYGAYYHYKNGNFTAIPEAQYVYAKPDQELDLTKTTANFGALLITDYKFVGSPWSVGSMAFYYKNLGSEAWYLSAHSAGYGIGVTPTWTHNGFFVRGEVGWLHLTDLGTGKGFGNDGTGRDQVMSILSGGLVF